MRKIATIALAVALLGLVVQVHGDIVLQKAKTGGHALGVRLGMTESEMLGLYTWYKSGSLSEMRTAFVDLNGVICKIEVSKEIVKSIFITFYSSNPQNTSSAVKSIVPVGAWKNNICNGDVGGVSYRMYTPHLLYVAFK